MEVGEEWVRFPVPTPNETGKEKIRSRQFKEEESLCEFIIPSWLSSSYRHGLMVWIAEMPSSIPVLLFFFFFFQPRQMWLIFRCGRLTGGGVGVGGRRLPFFSLQQPTASLEVHSPTAR